MSYTSQERMEQMMRNIERILMNMSNEQRQSLRNQAAIAAMQALLIEGCSGLTTHAAYAQEAVRYADALLAEIEKREDE